MTEASIIELYFARSEAAIDESERAYGRFCRRIAMNVLDDHEDAEESVNDTWLAAWNAIPPTRPDSLKAYFGRLTRRISISRLRKQVLGKFPQAFIIAFKNGTKVDVQAAIREFKRRKK